VYSSQPQEVARRWVSQGARLIHIVDLDGAFSGAQQNLQAIRAIREAVEVPLQVGGGLRSLQALEGLFRLGIERAILGTAAVEEPQLLQEACRRWPQRVLVGIDARDGRVAIKGWVEETGLDALQFARRMEALGVGGIIYTDISRDGMLSGPNIEATARMVRALKVPVIASGGVSALKDIEALLRIEGLGGVIIGKALYDGRLSLEEALELAGNAG